MKLRLLVCALSASLLAGCALQQIGAPVYNRTGSDGIATSGTYSTTGETYTVQPGDTLYSIAVRNGCNPTELARANNITDPTQVAIGTVLQLTTARTTPVQTLATQESQAVPAQEVIVGEVQLTPQAAPAAGQEKLGEVTLLWPVANRSSITKQFADAGSKGIEIAGNMGDEVKAAAAGRVLYIGNNVSGYGNLIIISHGPGAVTVYGHNSEVLVKRGDQVSAGQVISKMGDSDADSVNLLFEVRYNDKPVDPIKYLPQ